jgi:transposase
MVERSKFGPGQDHFSQNERNQAVVDEYESGRTIYEIASKFDLGIETVEGILVERIDDYEGGLN